jgi:predicted DNA-binding transcriptional regulator AlpA
VLAGQSNQSGALAHSPKAGVRGVTATELLATAQLARPRQQQQLPATASAPAIVIFLSDKQAAERLGVSRATLRRRVADGTVKPPVHFGKRCSRFPEHEIIELQERLMAERQP